MCIPARRDMGFVSSKMKEEILELYEEDEKRWTAATLSTRFGVPRANVTALLKLGQLRRQREAMLQTLNEEKKRKLLDLCTKATSAWATLPSVTGGGAVKRRVLRASSTKGIGDRNTSVQGQILAGVNDNNEAVKDSSKPIEANTDVEIKSEKSPWARYIEEHYRDVELDTVRRTTFAFIEVGRNQDLQRAVWIREGATGKLRLADDEERKLLTAQIKVRDSTAF